jgi:ribose transport system permease protein
MTVTAPPVPQMPPPTRPHARAVRFLRDEAWTGALVALLAGLLIWQSTQVYMWGAFELKTLFVSTLPLAFLALAQAVVVIAGGIDLSVGAQMVLFNCVSAYLMLDAGFGASLLYAALTLLLGMALGVLTGWIVTISGIPDIIVTLATSFVWVGLALWIMPQPAGGAEETFRHLFTGTGTAFWPALLCIAVPLVLIWTLLRRTRVGLSVYALGSDAQAAFLAGVDARKARISAYAVSGLFTALAGLATTAYTGGGQASLGVANTATLGAVAAVVLGGVALSGGVGGLLGPVLAVWSLFLIPANLLTLGVDPSYGEVVRGVVIVLVVLGGSLLRRKWSRT